MTRVKPLTRKKSKLVLRRSANVTVSREAAFRSVACPFPIYPCSSFGLTDSKRSGQLKLHSLGRRVAARKAVFQKKGPSTKTLLKKSMTDNPNFVNYFKILATTAALKMLKSMLAALVHILGFYRLNSY